MTVRVTLLYPELLGTYGDGGNATVLVQRLRWRGVDASVARVAVGDPVPADADLYVLGGGEDGPQTLAAAELRASGALSDAAARGAGVLAVCAGFQLLGRSFPGPNGARHDGLGLLDCETVRAPGRRMVGEVVAEPAPELGLPTLSGYENHQGATILGPAATPLGRVVSGAGNADGRTEGAIAGRVVGTYLHGPVLARNPALADLVLSWVVPDLPPLDDSEVDALRKERLSRRHRFRRAR